MNKLSAAQEKKILTALSKAASLVHEHADPNAALVKAAQEFQIPAGHVNLMVHAYNTARTNQTREGGSSILEKGAEFPLASAAAVLESLYPDQVKTAAQQYNDAVVDRSYSLPPAWTDAVQQQEKQAQHAAIDWSMCDTPAPLPRDPATAVKRAHSLVTDNKRRLEGSRRELADAENQLVGQLAKLAEYFRGFGSVSYADVKEAAVTYKGPAATAVFNQLERTYPKFAKRASVAPVQSVDWNATPFRELAACITSGQQMVEKRAALTTQQAACEKEGEAILRPFVQPRSQSCMAGLCSPSAGEKRAALGTLGTVLGIDAGKKLIGSIAGGMKPSSPDPAAVDGQLQDIASPDHETHLRDIQLQYTLQDMMANDPVISQHDPQIVTDAFNELTQTAPRATAQAPYMRAMLRKQLQQSSLDPFEVQQLADMESAVRKTTTPEKKENVGVSILTE